MKPKKCRPVLVSRTEKTKGPHEPTLLAFVKERVARIAWLVSLPPACWPPGGRPGTRVPALSGHLRLEARRPGLLRSSWRASAPAPGAPSLGQLGRMRDSDLWESSRSTCKQEKRSHSPLNSLTNDDHLLWEQNVFVSKF